MPDTSEVYWRVLTELRDGLVGADLGAQVRLRRRPLLMQDDPLPCLVVSPVPGEGERVEFEYFGGAAWAYPVLVSLFQAANDPTAVEPDLRAALALKQRVRDAVYRSSAERPQPAGQAGVWDVSLVANPAYEAAGGAARLYDVAAWVLTYLSDEPRAT